MNAGHRSPGLRVVGACLVCAIASSRAALADAPDAPAAVAARGLAGSVEVRHAGAPLRARPNQNLASPMLVRVAESRADDGGATIDRVEFIGAIAGDFDLRDLLEHADGAPASDLAPLPVRIVSQLPPNHGTDLYGLAEPPFTLHGWYRRALLAIGIAWIAVPAVVLARRAMRRRAPEPAPAVEPPPSLADLLRPLVEAARSRRMSVAERGRLELLLYRFWGEHLVDLPRAVDDGDSRAHGASSRADVMAALRAHPESGRLLRAVEGWLHGRREAEDERAGGESGEGRSNDGTRDENARDQSAPDETVAALLEPFAHVRLAPTPAPIASDAPSTSSSAPSRHAARSAAPADASRAIAEARR